MTNGIDAKVKLFLRSYAVKQNDEILWGCIGIKANKSVHFLQKSTYVMFDVLPMVDSTGIDMVVNPGNHDSKKFMEWYDNCKKGIVFDMDSVMVKPYDGENYFTDFKSDDANERRVLYAALRTLQEQWSDVVSSDIIFPGLETKYTVPANQQNKGSTHPHIHEYFDKKHLTSNERGGLVIYRADLGGRGTIEIDAERFALKLPNKISPSAAKFRQGRCMRSSSAVLY